MTMLRDDEAYGGLLIWYRKHHGVEFVIDDIVQVRCDGWMIMEIFDVWCLMSHGDVWWLNYKIMVSWYLLMYMYKRIFV